MNRNQIILLIFVLFSFAGSAQESLTSISDIKEEYSFTTKSFGKEEGYFIKEYKSSLVDDYGTLWISGTLENSTKNQFNKFNSTLLFFNGSKFQEFPFPDSLKQGDLKLLKGYGKEFFVLSNFEKQIKLLSIDPYTLTFKQIATPDFNQETPKYNKTFFFNNELFLLFTFETRCEIYKLSKTEELILFDTFNLEVSTPPYFETVVGFKQDILIHDKHSGVYLWNENNRKIKKITTASLDVNYEIEPKIKIKNDLNFRDTNFFKFNVSQDYYYYDEINSTWKTTNSNRFPFNAVSNEELFNGQSEILSFTSNKDAGSKELEIYLKSNYQKATSIALSDFTSTPKMNSRNYNKEVFVFNQNQLKQISFKRLKVKSFLKKYSIRAMLELDENRVLVGTELNGIKEINLKTGEEKEFYGFLDGKRFSPGPARGFYQDSSGIYTNYGSGICLINKEDKKITTYRYFPVMRFKNKGSSLYYLTNGYKLMRFDKESKTNIPLANTEGINMQELVFKGDTIYCATLSGLFIYYNGNQDLIKPQNSSEQFLCVQLHPKLGILVGTTDGKVLIYDSKSKSFSELYSDEFNSSIATLLVDNQNDIWINTFKGFIKYNLKDKSTIRFGVQDGFTNNEANRLASLKLKNGKLLVGTIKGLNYFSPSELTESKINSTLKFTGIEYYDGENNIKSVLSAKELKSANQIILQPQNRNVNLSFGFNDIIGLSENLRFKYKLNDDEWRVSNNFGELFLGNLAPDNYNLEIVAINKIERQIGNPISIKIIAKQFFYKTSWFWLLIISGLSFIAIWIVTQYIKNQKLKQEFADKIISAHIEEQASLSQKLHDGVGQKLLLAKNNFILHKKIPKEELSNIDEIINEVRNISHDLHPIQFKELGFKVSVENLVEDFQRNSTIFYSHDIECSKSILTIEKEIILFGILQECLNNVEKHSDAEACQIKIREKRKLLTVRILDNGKGFDVNEKAEKFSLGLKSMIEKANYLNAIMNIKSAKNEGVKTTIKVKIG